MKVLHLTLEKKWFDMIASGEKKEEYREITDYWIKRFHVNGRADDEEFKDWDVVLFRNGYAKNARTVTVEFLEMGVGRGNPEWGAERGKEYFVIKLGEIIPSPK